MGLSGRTSFPGFILSSAAFFILMLVFEYTSVTFRSVCPRKSLIKIGFTSASVRCMAFVCRKWGAPHFRHSKDTHLVNRGVNIYNVRDFLGHESVATTQVYLTTNPEITRKAIESVAEKTVPESLDFFSEEERDDLLSFLDSLG